jgi:glutathione transport system permease protein
MSLAVVGDSFPAYWIALVLIYTFSYTLGWFPVSGRGGPLWTVVGLSSIVLPAVTLAGIQAGAIVRVTRSSMLEALHSEYIRTARAKGVGEWRVLFKHALRNALLPVVTIIGWQIGWLLGGAVVTETVFSWPGLGRVTVSAILNRDFPLVQGAVLLGATAYVFVNLVVDVLYVVINPRASYR